MNATSIFLTGWIFTFGVLCSFGTFLTIGKIAIHIVTPTTDSDKSKFLRSGFEIKTDYKTGLQYISDGGCLMPRLDRDGKQLFDFINLN